MKSYIFLALGAASLCACVYSPISGKRYVTEIFYEGKSYKVSSIYYEMSDSGHRFFQYYVTINGRDYECAVQDSVDSCQQILVGILSLIPAAQQNKDDSDGARIGIEPIVGGGYTPPPALPPAPGGGAF